jgi:hypothetical protein
MWQHLLTDVAIPTDRCDSTYGQIWQNLLTDVAVLTERKENMHTDRCGSIYGEKRKHAY